MNTEEIFDLMKSDKEISKIFMGVYPIDLIPQDLPIPSIIVVNLDSSEKEGRKSLDTLSKKTCGVF